MKKIILILLCFSTLYIYGGNNQDTTARKSKWKIGINFSPDYCFRKLDSTGINSFNGAPILTIKNFRDSIEIPKFGYTAGISIGYDVSSLISIETGVFYSDKGYQTKWMGPFGNAGPESFSARLTYSFYYIDIPFKVDVVLLNKRKFKAYINAGFVFNLFEKAENTSIESGNSNTTTSSNDMSKYNSLNISVLGGIGLEYKCSDKVSLKLEPSFRYGLYRIIEEPITAYLWNAGVNVGVNYYFR
jgi:opacity protein-like surface antigen